MDSEPTVGGTGASCDGQNFWYGEEQLDVEAVHVMAPAAKELVVGGNICDSGDFGSQGVFDAETAILDGRGGKPLASIVSNTWSNFGESSQDDSLTNAGAGDRNPPIVTRSPRGIPGPPWA